MTFSDDAIQDERQSPIIPPENWDWEELHKVAMQTARRTYHGNDIEDFVQTALEKVHKHRHTVKYPKAYVKRSVTNLIIDYRKSKLALQETGQGSLPPGDDQWQTARDMLDRPITMIKPMDVAYQIASSDFFVTLLALVPETKRPLFIDHLEGISNGELAEIYGYSSAASVRQTLMRIRQDLKEQVEASGLLLNG